MTPAHEKAIAVERDFDNLTLFVDLNDSYVQEAVLVLGRSIGRLLAEFVEEDDGE